jgi:hypothetical protein
VSTNLVFSRLSSKSGLHYILSYLLQRVRIDVDAFTDNAPAELAPASLKPAAAPAELAPAPVEPKEKAAPVPLND